MIKITEPSPAECHPNCQGGCLIGFAPLQCESCSEQAEELGERCELVDYSEPLGFEGDYEELSWSLNEVDMDQVDATIEEKIKGDYQKLFVIFGGMFGLCFIWVLARCCCCDDDDDDSSDDEEFEGDVKE